MNRPRLRHIGPGLYETMDRRFRLERRSSLGPKGGLRSSWLIAGGPLEGFGYPTLTRAARAIEPYVRGWSGLAEDSGTVYLVHFDRPLGHARHYLGWTNLDSVEERMAKHRSGAGARLLLELNRQGIGYEVVCTWSGGRPMERRLKLQKNTPRLCPICVQLPVFSGQRSAARFIAGMSLEQHQELDRVIREVPV